MILFSDDVNQYVVQKHTGKLLGTCHLKQVAGRYIKIPYVTKRCWITFMKFRYYLKGSKTYIIAHGYRDAEMLPEFKRL